jgi:hypothetical protein
MVLLYVTHISSKSKNRYKKLFSYLTPSPPHRLLGFILIFYFSQKNNSKIPFHLLVNQKGLHLKYVKYISLPLAEKSQNTYTSLLISPWLFDLMYSVDVKNDLKNTEALEFKIVMLQFFLF